MVQTEFLKHVPIALLNHFQCDDMRPSLSKIVPKILDALSNAPFTKTSLMENAPIKNLLRGGLLVTTNKHDSYEQVKTMAFFHSFSLKFYSHYPYSLTSCKRNYDPFFSYSHSGSKPIDGSSRRRKVSPSLSNALNFSSARSKSVDPLSVMLSPLSSSL